MQSSSIREDVTKQFSIPSKKKRKRLHNRTRTQNIITWGIFLLVMFLVVYPLYKLILSSLNSAAIGEPYHFSMMNYAGLLNNLNLYGNSIFVAVMGTLLSTILGVSLAFILSRTDLPLRGLISTLIVIPFFIDSFFGAIAWVLLGSPNAGLLNIFFQSVFGLTTPPINIYSPYGIIWLFGIYYTPFSFLLTSGALKAMDPSLEEASYVNGGGRLKTTLKVTLPLIMPSILGGALLSMVMAIEQFSIPAIIGNQAKFFVVPTAIFVEMARFPPNYGTASALGLSLLIFTFVGNYFHNKILGNKSFQTITGKNFRPRIVKIGKYKWALLSIAFLYVFIAVLLPIGTIFWASLLKYITNNPANMQYSLKNYSYVLFQFPGTKKAILNSVLLAAIGATIVCFLMGMAAWIIHRTTGSLKKILEYTAMIPIAVPSMVFSIGLFWTWINIKGVYGTIWVILICYVTVYLPQGLRSISASLTQIDKSLEESAAVVGASWLYRFRTILMPLVAEGLLSAWSLVFILIMHNLGASLLLATSKNPVLPMAVYNLWENGNFTQLSALAMVQIVIILAVLSISKLIARIFKVRMGG